MYLMIIDYSNSANQLFNDEIFIGDDTTALTGIASGSDRHPDRTEMFFRLQIQGNQKLIPCFRTF